MAPKKVCRFGAKCYRKNPQHRAEYDHPGQDGDKKDEQETSPPKKKAKIDDYFGDGKDKTEKGTTDSAKPTESETEDKSTAAEKGDKSEEEPKSAAGGNASGYCRDESDDEEKSDDDSDKEDEEDSDSESDEEPPPSPADVKQNIKQKFLSEMPEDFYHFWDFAKSVNSKKPTDAFKSTLGLQLVGPFDVLAGNCKKLNSKGKRPCYLRHWRYYYDPPEFTTVLRGDDSEQFHMGYFRDDPKEIPAFVASNAAQENCTISPRGQNLFAAVNWFMEQKLKKDKTNAKLKKLQADLKSSAEEHSYSLDLKTKDMKSRDKNVVCKLFHGAGLVVPVDENEVGYREVPETPGDLKKMFKKIAEAKTEDDKNKAFDPLMELVMLVQFANDECDYGEGLELGMDLFCYGGEVFHKTILNLLPLAYQLLKRNEYAQIIKAHLKSRKHSADLNELA